MVIKFEEIAAKADEVVENCGSRNPYDIAEALGIIILERPFEKQLGVFLSIENIPFIMIKEDLDEIMAKIVILHEIGHFILHRDSQASPNFVDMNLFGKNNRMEYEANYFAAHISLPDEDFFELVKYGYNTNQIAQTMHSNPNLVALKINLLNNRGFKFNRQNYQSKFLNN